MDQGFTISWTNFNYTIHNSFLARTISQIKGSDLPETSQVLNGVNGHASAGQLVGVLGPSGSGKTSFMEALINKKRKGVSGKVNVTNSGLRSMNVALIPQTDDLLDSLTCRESIVFASQLLNCSSRLNQAMRVSSGDIHESIADKLIQQLGLGVCANTRAGQCSGGQRKRISLAQALVTTPAILVLDEPTSGLDSSAAEKVIEVLVQVVKENNTLIFVSIHQPSWSTFNLFDKVIMFSKFGGKIMFEGKPSSVPQHLQNFNVNYSSFSNPADVLVEVACGSNGQTKVQEMVTYQESCHKQWLKNSRHDVLKDPSLIAVMQELDSPFFEHFRTLFKRSVLDFFRSPLLVLFRLFTPFILPLLIFLVFEDAGEASGCPPIVNLKNVTSMSLEFMAEYQKQWLESMQGMDTVASMILLACLLGAFISYMSIILQLPAELPILIKECYNQMYKVHTYLAVKVIFESLIVFVSMVEMSTTNYYISEFPTDDFWRYVYFAGSNVVNGESSLLAAFVLIVIFIDNPGAVMIVTAMFIGAILPLESGWAIAFKDMSMAGFYVSMLSFEQYSINLFIYPIFSYDRCGEDVQQVIDVTYLAFKKWNHDMKISFINGWQQVLDAQKSDLTGLDLLENQEELNLVLKEKYFRGFFTRSGIPGPTILAAFDLDEDDVGPNLLNATFVGVFSIILTWFLLHRRVFQ